MGDAQLIGCLRFGCRLELQHEHAALRRQAQLAQQRGAMAEAQAQDEARTCSTRLELQAQQHAHAMAAAEQRSKFQSNDALRQAQAEAADATSRLNALEQLHASVVAGADDERRSAVLAATTQTKREAEIEFKKSVAAEIAAAVSTANLANSKALLDLRRQKEQAEEALSQAAAAHEVECAGLKERAAVAAAAAGQAKQECSREADELAATKKVRA